MKAPRSASAARATATTLLAGLLAACSFIPQHQTPPAPVAADWPAAAPGNSAGALPTGQVAPDLAWADFLPDARLRALVDIALRNNRDLRVAALNVEQLRALYGVQRADRLPTVGVGANASSAPNSAGSNTTTYSVGLQLSAYELDFFGRVKSLSEAAMARYLASVEGRRSAQVSLVAAVASAELALRADDALLQVTQTALATREQSLRLARVRFEGGVAAEGELRGAESLLATARAGLAALQRQRSQDLNALVLLLGQPLPADLPAAAPLDTLALAELPAGLPSEVMLQRPDIRQAEQQLIAANANIGAARAAFFPRISLTGSLGTASTQLSGLFEGTAWTLGGQVLQPLFDAGRNQANLEAVRAAHQIAVAQYDKAVQTAFREVADALAGRATLGDQLAAQQALAAAETRRLELANLLFKGGAAGQLEVLDAERSLLAARQAVVQVQLARLVNSVQVYRALGGGAGPAAPQAAAR